MNDIIVCYIKLPMRVNGMVLPTPEGDYQILINASLSAWQQQQAFNHEVRHLLAGHHQSHRPVQALEAEANAKDALLEMIKDAEKNGLPLQTVLFPRQAEGHSGTGKAAQSPPAAENDAFPKAGQAPSLLDLRRAALTGLYYTRHNTG